MKVCSSAKLSPLGQQLTVADKALLKNYAHNNSWKRCYHFTLYTADIDIYTPPWHAQTHVRQANLSCTK